MEHINLNALAARVHKANQKWWVSLDTGEPIERNRYELLMLMQSEVAEAMEGERKGLADDKIIHRPMAEVEMADVVIRALDYAGGFDIYVYDATDEFTAEEWVSLAHWRKFRPDSNRGEVLFNLNSLINDVAISSKPKARAVSRIIAGCRIYCKLFGYDLWGAFEDKIAFNEIRIDHTKEARSRDGGKKW